MPAARAGRVRGHGRLIERALRPRPTGDREPPRPASSSNQAPAPAPLSPHPGDAPSRPRETGRAGRALGGGGRRGGAPASEGAVGGPAPPPPALQPAEAPPTSSSRLLLGTAHGGCGGLAPLKSTREGWWACRWEGRVQWAASG